MKDKLLNDIAKKEEHLEKAYFKVGLRYMFGFEVKQNYRKGYENINIALNLYRKKGLAIYRPSILIEFSLFPIYKYGYGVYQNDVKATLAVTNALANSYKLIINYMHLASKANKNNINFDKAAKAYKKIASNSDFIEALLDGYKPERKTASIKIPNELSSNDLNALGNSDNIDDLLKYVYIKGAILEEKDAIKEALDKIDDDNFYKRVLLLDEFVKNTNDNKGDALDTLRYYGEFFKLTKRYIEQKYQELTHKEKSPELQVIVNNYDLAINEYQKILDELDNKNNHHIYLN